MGSTVTDKTNYSMLQTQIEGQLSSQKRFVPMEERRDTSFLPAEIMPAISSGKYITTYRGVPLMKDPFTLAVVPQLLWELKPRTIIEFGSYAGASALWMADLLRQYNYESRVLSLDIDLSMLAPLARDSRSDISFIEGDVFDVEKHFHKELLESLPHPWFLSEDSHVNMMGVLEHFHKFMQPGDYLCIEDTNPKGPEISGQGLIKDLGYSMFGDSKLNDLKRFLKDHPGKYMVDQKYTDFYGYNVTLNTNGFLKRV
nr:rhamnosyl O-methyltransferase-like [Pocillopora verrucosa]